MSIKTVQVPVKGLTCVNCARTVGSTIKSFGARDVEVNLSSEIAEIKFDRGIDWEKLVRELEDYGYSLLLNELKILLHDVDSAGLERLEKVVGEMDGVVHVAVDSGGVLRVLYSSIQVQKGDILRKVRSMGFSFRVLGEGEDIMDAEIQENEKHLRSLRNRVIVSVLLSIPLLIAHLGFHINPFLQLLLATPVQFGPGMYFIRGAWNALKKRNPDMNLLIATGTLSGYGGSLLHFLNPSIFQHVYFETSALIITIVLIGRYLEARAKHMTTGAIRKLLSLKPATALLERDGTVVEVPADEVDRGDVFILKSGMRVPADGEILEGEGYFDESHITGESAPVKKRPRAIVIGGSVMLRGYVRAVARRVGSETLVSQIVRMVREGQFKKARFQSIADRISGIFVQVVVSFALLVFAIWLLVGPVPRLEHALLAMVSVLVVACPCAIGIAIPSVVSVAMGRGASMGILIRTPSVLEEGSSIDTVVFDKTGTLTQGKPVVRGDIPAEHMKYIASLEALSEHPVAMAILEHYGDGPLYHVEGFRVFEGMGVSGIVNGRMVAVGNGRLMKRLGIEHPGGEGILYYIQGLGTGSFRVEDSLKPESREVVSALKSMGYSVYIVSGDSRENVEGVARILGVDGFYHSVLPHEKVEIIDDFRKRGRRVAFVGDGINDAAVLSHANMGIAVGGATDIAKEAGDVILMHGDLRKILTAIRLCRAASRRIKWNLFWTFIYNVSLIPMAGGLFYLLTGRMFDPVWSAIAMGLSDVSVVGNALLLYRFSDKSSP